MIRSIINKLKDIVRGGQIHNKEAQMFSKDMEAFQRAERLWVSALAKSTGDVNEEVSANGKTASTKEAEKYQLRKEFADEFDAWDKRQPKGAFQIGTTSEALKSIGIKDTTIIWDKSQIRTIMTEHEEMTADVIKQVPNVLENPVIALASNSVIGRVVLIGDIIANGKPVIAVLELNPVNRKGTYINSIKIASSYGKDRAKSLFKPDWSNVLYLDPNKKEPTAYCRPFGSNCQWDS